MLLVTFQVVRSEVFYWKVDDPDVFSPNNFPAFVYQDAAMPGIPRTYIYMAFQWWSMPE